MQTASATAVMAYRDIIKAIVEQASKINLVYSKHGDGRLTSAIKETDFLAALERGLAENHPTIKFETQPSTRWWWDFRVNHIPFNLKLTTGGTDNAFNKVAVLYSVSGEEPVIKSMNFNQFYRTFSTMSRKVVRDPMTEYHYLTVNKNEGQVLVRSIFDIESYRSNPSNHLQIDWGNEMKVLDTAGGVTEYEDKINHIMKVIQSSVRQSMANMKEFANAEL